LHVLYFTAPVPVPKTGDRFVIKRRDRPVRLQECVRLIQALARGLAGRMNTELVESALAAHGRRLVVLDDGEARPAGETNEPTGPIHVFC
jgi:hypothetical protein